MNARPARPAAWLLVTLVLVAAVATMPLFAQDKGKGGAKDDDKEMAGKGAPDEAGAEAGDGADKPADGMEPKGARGKRGGKNAKADKEPKSRLYVLKSQKKGKLAGAEMLTLLVQDPFTGKSDTLYVPNSDPKARAYDPLPEVAAAVEGLEEGAVLEVEAEKQKGKWMVSSLAKADVKPGEEQPNGFVYVDTSEHADRGGNRAVVVTLTKFGREVKVGVPMWKNKDHQDASWEPDPKIDSQLRQLQGGDVVEAVIKNGRPPMLVEIHRLYPPERGKFLALKETTYGGAAAAAFEMVAEDGTTLTILLPGTEQSRNGQTMLMPEPRMLNMVRKIKPDTEIEIMYRQVGSAMFLRTVKFLNAGKAAKDEKGSKSGKKEAGMSKPAGPDEAEESGEDGADAADAPKKGGAGGRKG